MKSLRLISGIVALSAFPASAHDGEHSVSFIANIGHWLSSPSHSLFAVIGGIILAGFILKFNRKKI